MTDSQYKRFEVKGEREDEGGDRDYGGGIAVGVGS
jgi:hypothetical protein